jgi:hypothetical protein
MHLDNRVARTVRKGSPEEANSALELGFSYIKNNISRKHEYP